jgi:hypothetical protein
LWCFTPSFTFTLRELCSNKINQYDKTTGNWTFGQGLHYECREWKKRDQLQCGPQRKVQGRIWKSSRENHLGGAYWTERTAVAPYLKKGQLVYAEGSPEVRSYTKNDGTAGTSLTLRVLNVQLLGSSRNESGGVDATGAGGAESDDLPF